ncbi:MAG: TIGR03862 family flavoprotein [Desulfobulbaceae bacterium]|nr:TIGR03862 family flavoprotein [Desulfobulbaceae bacterium]HIJ90074.1 TIGR03862 family flavoprotein [Deltaproteobacteria bacterium]
MKEMPRVAVIGCGPAGLMAATVLSEAGLVVDIFETKGSAGRKFLVAGRGGLNLTHSEQAEPFAARYGNNAAIFKKLLTVFSPADLRAWLRELGVETFIGTSGRVFPKDATAPDILKIWLETLGKRGVVFHYHHRWQGFSQTGDPLFLTETGVLREFPASAVLLALGGASWPQTGSDGSWTAFLAAKGIFLEPFRPANCGIEVAWSEHIRTHFSGKPLKNILLRCGDRQATGDVIITTHGLEGGPVYALSGMIRDLLEKNSPVPIFLDLKRDLLLERLQEKLEQPRSKESLANFLRKAIHLTGPAYSLLREICPPEDLKNPAILAGHIKNLPVPIIKTRPLAEAISSAGGITFPEVNADLMLHKLPGVFVAGEMLDWEAPTGGYLLQGAFSTGYQAAKGLLKWLGHTPPQPPPSSRPKS